MSLSCDTLYLLPFLTFILLAILLNENVSHSSSSSNLDTDFFAQVRLSLRVWYYINIVVFKSGPRYTYVTKCMFKPQRMEATLLLLPAAQLWKPSLNNGSYMAGYSSVVNGQWKMGQTDYEVT